MPMPSNQVRGAVTRWVVGLWSHDAVRYTFMGIMGLNVFYFYFVMDAMLHPLYDLGFLTPIEQAPTCELKMGECLTVPVSHASLRVVNTTARNGT